MTTFFLSITIMVVTLMYIGAIHLFKLNRGIDMKEMLAGIFLSVVIPFGISTLAAYHAASSIEIWNGQVTSKYRDTVSCEHSNTVCTGSGDKQRCTTTYDHWNDYDWVVKTTAGDFTIDRVDRQGRTEPPRFSAVKIGEPASMPHSYHNWLRMNNTNDYFYRIEHTDKSIVVPEYPSVFDYHRINRVRFAMKNQEPDLNLYKTYNQRLNELLKTYGTLYQINIIMVITDQTHKAAPYIKGVWGGGEKNDMLVFVGVDEDHDIKWNKVYSFSEDQSVNNFVSTAITGAKSLKNVDHVMAGFEVEIPKYKRISMAQFESYKDHYQFSGWEVFISILVSIFIMTFYIIAAKRFDIFG